MSDDIVAKLATTIRARRQQAATTSYTRQLLDAGPERCARKFGEEALEVVIASFSNDKAALASESADAIYHLLVLLECCHVNWDDVAAILDARAGTSGLTEKASRQREPS